MAKIDPEVFLNKLDDVRNELGDKISNIQVGLAGVVAEFRSQKPHDSPCNFLSEHINSQSEKVKELHNQHKEHIYEYHSSKNTRDNWGVYATIICAFATLAGVFVSMVAALIAIAGIVITLTQ